MREAQQTASQADYGMYIERFFSLAKPRISRLFSQNFGFGKTSDTMTYYIELYNTLNTNFVHHAAVNTA
jgi:hypothetical protein